MRSLTYKHRLQAQSVPEITEEIERLTMIHSRKFRFKNRRLKPGPVMNALAAVFIDLSAEEQEQILRRGLDRLEGILACSN